MVESERLKVLGKGPRREGPVAYWMSRDQRVDDNWSLAAAQEMALARKAPLAVLFCLVPAYKGASRESFAFMLGGLIETARELARRKIPLVFLRGDPAVEIPRWAGEGAVSVLFCDFDPLREKRRWQEAVASKIGVPLFEIDGHNVVPCRFASPKQEYAAYTFRPTMKRLLSSLALAATSSLAIAGSLQVTVLGSDGKPAADVAVQILPAAPWPVQPPTPQPQDRHAELVGATRD